MNEKYLNSKNFEFSEIFNKCILINNTENNRKNINLFNCRYCEKYSTLEEINMIRHYKMSHNGKLMKCSKCKFTCYHNKDFILHNLDKHFN